MARNNRSRSNPQPQSRNRTTQEFGDESSRSAFGQLADTVREHPKTAIAAGAAVAAGAVAAAVLSRGRDKDD